MSIDDFNKLSKPEQYQQVATKGNLLLKKDTLNHKISVYSLHGFFVECWKNKTNQFIDSLLAFSNIKLLEKYSDQVNIDDLKSS